MIRIFSTCAHGNVEHNAPAFKTFEAAKSWLANNTTYLGNAEKLCIVNFDTQETQWVQAYFTMTLHDLK